MIRSAGTFQATLTFDQRLKISYQLSVYLLIVY